MLQWEECVGCGTRCPLWWVYVVSPNHASEELFLWTLDNTQSNSTEELFWFFFFSVVVYYRDIKQDFLIIYTFSSFTQLQKWEKAILDLKKRNVLAMSFYIILPFSVKTCSAVLLFGLSICTDYMVLSQFLLTSTIFFF